MIIFLIKSAISLIVIYSLYMIFMAKENIPIFRRYFLLFGIIFSFLIPFLKFHLPVTSTEMLMPNVVNNQIIEINAIGSNVFSSDSPNFGIAKYVFVVLYLSISMLLAIRYFHNIYQLIYVGKNAQQLDGYKIAVIKGKTPPYSFLNTIYVNKKDYNNGKICKEILIHELTHIKQKHSIDILLMEFLQIVFWFNPILLLLKKEIKLNHEYLADKAVVSSEIDIFDYQNFMINSVFRNNSTYLASNFNYSFIKKRIIMLEKEKSPTRLLIIKGTSIFSFIMLLTIVFTLSSNAMPIGTDKWWEPILKKHNLKTVSNINIGNVFEMGDNSSIKNDICNLTNATMIIRGENNSSYLIIQADRIVHNIKTGTLKIEAGKFKRYAEINADISAPQSSGSGTMEINLNDIIKSNLFSKDN